MSSPVPSASIPADAAAVTALNAEERTRILAKAALFSPPSAVTADGRRDIVGLSREELTEILVEIGEKPFRTKQLWHWIYHQGVTDFSLMSSIAKPLQQKLAEKFIIARPEPTTVQTSQDETRKFLFRFRDGQEAETVYIPDRREDRGAVCISSQVGCTLSCTFCHTGTQKLVRNLGAAEIVGQFMAARDSYGEWPSPKGDTPRLLSTIVLMGMGEPLYNYENIAKAMRIIMDGEGIGLSRRRITLSTSGVVPLMDAAGMNWGSTLRSPCMPCGTTCVMKLFLSTVNTRLKRFWLRAAVTRLRAMRAASPLNTLCCAV